MKKTVASLIMMLLCFVLASCGGGDSGPSSEPPSPSPTPTPSKVAVTGVTLNKSTLALEVGGKETLTATVSPSNATNKTVTWSSDKTSVATVSDGTVTAVAAGTATITVTTADGNKTASCTVTVTNPSPSKVAVTGVSLDKASLTLDVGGTATLTATVTPSNATDKTVNWTSSNTGVATVDANGKVTAVAAGIATITVKTKDGEKTAPCIVTVNAPAPPTGVKVTSVALNTATLSLAVNDVAQLTATAKPDDASDKSVTWASSDTNVATVAADGKVTAKAAGTAYITATAKDGSGKKGTCKVTVLAGSNSVHGSGDVSSEGQDW